LDQDLYDELRFHLDERVDELIRRGHSPVEAEREALRQLGRPSRLIESSRDAKLVHWMASCRQDAQFGLRVLRRNAAPAAAVVLSLSIAIGAVTTVFSLIDALLVRPAPVPNPGNLIVLSYDGPGSGGGLAPGENVNFSYPLLNRLRAAAGTGAGLFGVTFGGPYQAIRHDGSDEPVRPQWISGNGFDVLGLTPAQGRHFTEEDDWREKESVTVLSYRYWTTRFHGDPGAIGRTLDLIVRGQPYGTYRIVGVAPERFEGMEPGAPADLWFPLPTRVGGQPARRPDFTYFQIHGRMHSADVETTLQTAFRAIRGEYEKELLPPNADPNAFRSATLRAGGASATSSYVRTQYQKAFWIVAAIVALVFIVACSNIANFLVARAAAREREMALRIAIGAGRGRLVRQVLIESGILALAACVGGLAIALYAGPQIVTVLGPSDFPAFLDLRPDTRLLSFLLVTGIAATLLFGLAPAWRASLAEPALALRSGDAAFPRSSGSLRPFFVMQVAFGFVVLYLSGLLFTSFRQLQSIDLGFPSANLHLWLLNGPAHRVDASHLLASVRAWPGVDSAAVSSCALADNNMASAPILLPGSADPVRVAHIGVAPGFFATIGLPIALGRDLTAAEVAADPSRSVLVNEAFVRRFLPGRNPIGAEFLRRGRSGPLPQTIVGVVPDARYIDARVPDHPVVFAPWKFINQSTLTIRPTPGADPAVWKQRLAKDFPGVAITSTGGYDAVVGNRTRRERLLAWLAAFLSILTALIVTLGLHGVLGYTLTRRTQEIGLRLAVGAPPLRVTWEIIRSAAAVTAAGAVIGAVASILLTPLVSPLLFAPGNNWSRFAAPLACLAFAWTVTALPAALRLRRVNPALTLRHH